MSKIKTILICLLIAFLILIGAMLAKIKDREVFQQRTVLAQQIRKVLGYLMVDLRDAREDTIQDVPADGQWHSRFAFENTRQGPLEYLIKDGQLLRINGDKQLLVADDIADLRIRRQQATPDILEVQIKAQSNVSLVSNLKIRIR